MEPPISILAGEYGVWASQYKTTEGGNKDSLQYSISGLALYDPIILHWYNPYSGRNSYEPSKAPEGFELKVLRGKGSIQLLYMFLVINRDICTISYL